MRVATWHADLSREGPGLLLRDLAREDETLDPVLRTIAEVGPDILLLTRVDWDHGGAALAALRAALKARGAEYPHALSLRPNTGRPTGIDVDGDGLLGTARDAQGYGIFAGQGGLALLSSRTIDTPKVTDLTSVLWRDVPDALISRDDPAAEVQRLSTTGHWVVPVQTGRNTLTVLAFHATPPVFDGPEDRNGRRNADEIRLWQVLLDGGLDLPAPSGPVVIVGNANLDPAGATGRHAAIRSLLADPRLQDPLPGIPTVDWSRLGLGELRVSYVLPGRDLTVEGAGAVTVPGSEHRLVWVDLDLP